MSNVEQVVIIGSGPAGNTAGLYAARAQLNPLVISSYESQLAVSHEVENFPGFEFTTGPDLNEKFEAHSKKFGCRYQYGIVSEVDFTCSPKKITVGSKVIEAHTVIIATGSSAKWLNLPSEQAFMGLGVSACVTCDIGFCPPEGEIVLVGGGNTAMEEAIQASNHVKHVHMVHRRDEFRGERILRDRVEKNEKITVHWDSVLDEVLGNESGVTGARIKNVKTGETTEFEVPMVFIAIGHKPNSAFLADSVELEHGYVSVKGGMSAYATQTSVEGVFAAGDIADHTYRQAITSAGTGCMAALDVERYLTEHDLI
ncbi:hypothetical protein PCE1_002134 [Barthelona sp. PCE]